MVAETVRQLGRVDILINNAAFARGPDRVPTIELKDDITEVFRNIDRQEGRNRGNVEDVRDLINAFELRVDSKMTRLDEQIDTLESKLDLRIKAALENPLAK